MGIFKSKKPALTPEQRAVQEQLTLQALEQTRKDYRSFIESHIYAVVREGNRFIELKASNMRMRFRTSVRCVWEYGNDEDFVEAVIKFGNAEQELVENVQFPIRGSRRDPDYTNEAVALVTIRTDSIVRKRIMAAKAA